MRRMVLASNDLLPVNMLFEPKKLLAPGLRLDAIDLH
jgi:hypothetical protein